MHSSKNKVHTLVPRHQVTPQVAGTRTVNTRGNFSIKNVTLLQHCFHVKTEISIYISGFKTS
jgi:hypothetical protein